MKHLLLSLLVAFTLASCGKDGNKVSSNYMYTDPLSNPNGTQYPMSIYLAQAKTALENNGAMFGFGGIKSSTISDTKCKDWWIFDYCKNKYTTKLIPFKDISSENIKLYYIYANYSSNIYESVAHSSVDVTERVNYLSRLFANASNITTNGIGTYFQVYIGSEVYHIDTQYPVQANPIFIQNGSVRKELKFFQML